MLALNFFFLAFDAYGIVNAELALRHKRAQHDANERQYSVVFINQPPACPLPCMCLAWGTRASLIFTFSELMVLSRVTLLRLRFGVVAAALTISNLFCLPHRQEYLCPVLALLRQSPSSTSPSITFCSFLSVYSGICPTLRSPSVRYQFPLHDVPGVLIIIIIYYYCCCCCS